MSSFAELQERLDEAVTLVEQIDAIFELDTPDDVDEANALLEDTDVLFTQLIEWAKTVRKDYLPAPRLTLGNKTGSP